MMISKLTTAIFYSYLINLLNCQFSSEADIQKIKEEVDKIYIQDFQDLMKIQRINGLNH